MTRRRNAKEGNVSKSLSLRHIHHHIHSALQLVLAVGEVDDKEEKEDESEGGTDADLGVLRQPEPERALARLPWRVLGVLKQQGSDVLELGAQICLALPVLLLLQLNPLHFELGRRNAVTVRPLLLNAATF